jgi:hypothetical protein
VVTDPKAWPNINPQYGLLIGVALALVAVGVAIGWWLFA